MTERRALAYALLSCGVMATIPVLQKLTLVSLPPLENAFWNASLCAMACFIWIGFQGRLPNFRPQVDIPAAGLHAAAMAGLMISLTRLHPSTVALTTRLYGVFGVLAGWLVLKERLRPRSILWIGGVLCGSLGFVFEFDLHGEFWGFVGALVYAAGFALNNAFLKTRLQPDRSWDVLFWSYALSGLLFAFWNIPLNEVWIWPSQKTWGILAISALGGSVLGTMFFYRSLKALPLSVTATLRSFSPLFTTLIALPFFPLHMHPWNVASGVLATLCLALLAVDTVKVRTA